MTKPPNSDSNLDEVLDRVKATVESWPEWKQNGSALMQNPKETYREEVKNFAEKIERILNQIREMPAVPGAVLPACVDCGVETKKRIRSRCRKCYDKARRPSSNSKFRTCGYCGGVGHNVRACSRELEDSLGGMDNEDFAGRLQTWLEGTRSSITVRQHLLVEEAVRRLLYTTKEDSELHREICTTRIENSRLQRRIEELENGE